jgi:hypothetical protein
MACDPLFSSHPTQAGKKLEIWCKAFVCLFPPTLLPSVKSGSRQKKQTYVYNHKKNVDCQQKNQSTGFAKPDLAFLRHFAGLRREIRRLKAQRESLPRTGQEKSMGRK